MDGGWAKNAARKQYESEHKTDISQDLALRAARLKDEIGSSLFLQLITWFNGEVAIYNKERRQEELRLEDTTDYSEETKRHKRQIQITRLIPHRQPLKITYSPALHIIEYECGAGKGAYLLKVGEDGQHWFETPYHTRKTIDEMGTEMLNKLMESQF